jgi:hypothetical protein
VAYTDFPPDPASRGGEPAASAPGAPHEQKGSTRMFPEIQPLKFMISVLKDRLALLRQDREAGYTAEAVIVIGLMVVAAIAIVTIIVNKITTRAQGINMGG